MNDYGRALADFDDAIRLDPQNPRPHSVRAWLLATCPDPKIRDGNEALKSAERARELSGQDSLFGLSALAAACAETGDFEAAVRWVSKAIELVSSKDHAVATVRFQPDSLQIFSPEKGPSLKFLQSRLESYRARKPYREAPAKRPVNDRAGQPHASLIPTLDVRAIS
jgi:tetratricopeptide (TPR) repeat protein